MNISLPYKLLQKVICRTSVSNGNISKHWNFPQSWVHSKNPINFCSSVFQSTSLTLVSKRGRCWNHLLIEAVNIYYYQYTYCLLIVTSFLLILDYNYYISVLFYSDWDSFQEDFECCGSDKPSSWADIISNETSVPDSCCKTYSEGCGSAIESFDDPDIYQEGCKEDALDSLKGSLIIMGALAFFFGILMISGAVAGAFLAVIIKDVDRYLSLNESQAY